MNNGYLLRSAVRPSQIKDSIHPNTNIIVVIPCFNEPELIPSLEALLNNESTNGRVEVIVVVNQSEIAEEDVINQNVKTISAFNLWNENNSNEWIKFYCLFEKALPKKHAGVGLARKIGMDEAVYRFDSIGKQEGIIVCFDADSLCQQDYLKSIETAFENNPSAPGCAIHYEHPISGENYDKEVYDGIIQYELFLRYYVQGLRYANFPYAYHTIGSSMAVRSSAYQKQGGMNKRKAGEDFYFISKIIPLGNFFDLNTTKVIPSPRSSDRVPFGTGKAIGDYLLGNRAFLGYHPAVFDELKVLFDNIPSFYTDSFQQIIAPCGAIKQFLENNEVDNKVNEFRLNSTNLESFTKRFLEWFNAFKILKFVHFYRDNYQEDVNLEEASLKLLEKINVEVDGNPDLKQLLGLYRLLDTKKVPAL